MIKWVIFLGIFICVLFWEVIFKGSVAVPTDTLVGAYWPWLNYKWGYSVGVPVKNALISDVFSQFFIWKHVGLDQLFKGRLPLWNPYVLMGTPFLATYHSALLFPGNILFLLPKFWGWNVYIMASFLWAMFWMYLYLFQITSNKLGSFLGSIIFSLAGPMTTWAEFGTAVWAAGCMPFVLWAIEKRKFYLITIGTACLFLAGHVQLSTYFSLIFTIYVFLKFGWKRELFISIIFFTLGVGLAGIQLIPTFQFYKSSIRQNEKFTSHINYGLTPWYLLLRFIVPDFYGHPVTNNYRSQFEYHEYTGFFGTYSAVLVLAALLCFSKNKLLNFWKFMFLGSLFLTIDNPISRFVFRLPLPLFTYSAASRLYFLTGLSASVLIAKNLDFLKKKPIFISLLFLVTIFISLILVEKQYLVTSFRNSILPIFILISGSLLIYLRSKITLIILVLITCFDLAKFFRKYNPLVPENTVFPVTPLISFLKEHNAYRFVSLSNDVLPLNTWMYYGLRSPEGYDPMHLQGFNHFAQVLNNQDYGNSPFRYVDIQTPNLKLLDSINVGYYLFKKSTRPSPELLKNTTFETEIDNVDIYKSKTVKSEKYLVYTHRVVEDEKQLSTQLSAQGFDPRQEIILLKQPKYKNNFLVYTESYDLGWKAYLDGEPIEILRTNAGLMSVALKDSSDAERVVFRYQPDSLIAGVIVSLISFVSFIVSKKYVV